MFIRAEYEGPGARVRVVVFGWTWEVCVALAEPEMWKPFDS